MGPATYTARNEFGCISWSRPQQLLFLRTFGYSRDGRAQGSNREALCPRGVTDDPSIKSPALGGAASKRTSGKTSATARKRTQPKLSQMRCGCSKEGKTAPRHTNPKRLRMVRKFQTRNLAFDRLPNFALLVVREYMQNSRARTRDRKDQIYVAAIARTAWRGTGTFRNASAATCFVGSG